MNDWGVLGDFSRYVIVNRVTFDVSRGTVTPLPDLPPLAPGESGLFRYWKNRGTTEGGTK